MALGKAILSAFPISAIAMACSCVPPPDLCSRLEPNMVAFVGRPLSTVPSGKWRKKTTFRIEERLWGTLPAAGSISVESADISAPELNKSWFVLAGQRFSGTAGSGEVVYYVDFTCCPFGLVLPTEHTWVKEFRDNVAQRKQAALRAEIRSQSIALANFKVRIDGSGYSWEGISGSSAMDLKLPPGDYRVRIEKTHFTQPEESRHVSILPGACTVWWIPADPTSTISGRIADFRGVSAKGLYYRLEGEVTLDASLSDSALLDSAIVAVRRTWQRLTGWGAPPTTRPVYFVTPDSNGRFQTHVLPGKYRFSAVSPDSHDSVFPPPIPKTFYPGVLEESRASEIVVSPGGQSEIGDFHLPEYGGLRRVEVVLVNEDGSPAPNQVVAHTGRYPGDSYRTAGWTQKLTDAQGRAVFEVWQSLDYRLHLSSGSFSGDAVDVSAGNGPVSRRFVMRPYRPSTVRQ